MEKKKKQTLKQKLAYKYRFVVQNEDYEEKKALSISKLKILLIVGGFFFITVLITYLAISYSPLKNIIPGYTSIDVRKQGFKNTFKTDSLERIIKSHNLYIKNLQAVINGESPLYIKDKAAANEKKVVRKNKINFLKPGKNDSLLKAIIGSQEILSLLMQFKSNKMITAKSEKEFLFRPTEGVIVNKFNPQKEHFGIDIVSSKKEPVKSILEGTVIFAGWTLETGFVIQIQHKSNLLSIYKHNETLQKSIGDHVKVGEIIALVGNSGEYTSGYHLHFELWKDGIPLNPELFIMF